MSDGAWVQGHGKVWDETHQAWRDAFESRPAEPDWAALNGIIPQLTSSSNSQSGLRANFTGGHIEVSSISPYYSDIEAYKGCDRSTGTNWLGDAYFTSDQTFTVYFDTACVIWYCYVYITVNGYPAYYITTATLEYQLLGHSTWISHSSISAIDSSQGIAKISFNQSLVINAIRLRWVPDPQKSMNYPCLKEFQVW